MNDAKKELFIEEEKKSECQLLEVAYKSDDLLGVMQGSLDSQLKSLNCPSLASIKEESKSESDDSINS